jgi:hypothetical protein
LAIQGEKEQVTILIVPAQKDVFFNSTFQDNHYLANSAYYGRANAIKIGGKMSLLKKFKGV